MSEASDGGAEAPARDAGETVESGPTAGERARTMAYGMAGGLLAVPGVPYAAVPAHVTDEDGWPLLLVTSESPAVKALRGAGAPGVPATLEIADVAPVPLADRVRGRARLRGLLCELSGGELREAALRLAQLHPRPELLDLGGSERHQSWTVLALEVAEVEIEDAWGEATLHAEEYAIATPDPFVAIEGGLLGHLDAAHRPELGTMLRRLKGVFGVPRDRLGEETVVRPLALDRYGMWLRCSGQGPDVPVDVRVAFGEPVSDVHGLRCVYRKLFAGAHS